MRDKLSKRFEVRLTDSEHAKLIRLADRSGISASSAVRFLIRDCKMPAPRTAEVKEEIRLLQKISSNLNQIAAVANTHHKIEDELLLKETLEDHHTVLQAIYDRLSER